jgi:predicted nucleic acid-binding protein
MKFTDVLRGHLFPNEAQVKAIWEKADFCFDTNVLLDVYRYTDENRAAFLKLLAALKGRIFVPHRVAVEFGRNRITVIRGHFRPQHIIRSKLDEALKEIEKQHAKHPLLADLKALVAAAKKLVDDKYGADEEKHLDLIVNDSIFPHLLAAIGEDVGDPYDEEEAKKEYKRRKEGAIPPFCKVDDSKDESRQTGDVVIWLELIKKYQGKGKPLIFVTDDMKENWWQESGGGRRDAQPALVQEAFAKAKAEILFYTSERFNQTAPARLGIEIPKELAEETKRIREQEQAAKGNLGKGLQPEAERCFRETIQNFFDLSLLRWREQASPGAPPENTVSKGWDALLRPGPEDDVKPEQSSDSGDAENG